MKEGTTGQNKFGLDRAGQDMTPESDEQLAAKFEGCSVDCAFPFGCFVTSVMGNAGAGSRLELSQIKHGNKGEIEIIFHLFELLVV